MKIQKAATTPASGSGKLRNTIAAAHTESNTSATARITSDTPIANTSHKPLSLLSSPPHEYVCSATVYPGGTVIDFMNASCVRVASFDGPRKS